MIREGIIYLITNRVNGKKYVGQTVDALASRWKRHLRDSANGSNCALHRAIRKYGEDSFTLDVIANTLVPFLDELERMYITLYMSRDYHNGYNLTDGGDGTRGWAPTDAYKQRMRESCRGKVVSDETRGRISESLMNREFSETHRSNLSIALKESSRLKESNIQNGLKRRGRRLGPSRKPVGVSGYRGVTINRQGRPTIQVWQGPGKKRYVASFSTVEEAAIAYAQKVAENA